METFEPVLFTKPGRCPKCGAPLAIVRQSIQFFSLDQNGNRKFEYEDYIDKAVCYCDDCDFTIEDLSMEFDGPFRPASPYDGYIYKFPLENNHLQLDSIITEKTFTGNPFIK